MKIKICPIKKIKLSLLFFVLIGQLNIFSQDKEKDRKFAVELDMGYNTLKWKAQDNFFNTNSKYVRDKFWITPNCKFVYYFSIKSFSEELRYKIAPFLGHYIFGGKSRIEPNGYRDQYIFKSFELGLFNSLFVKNNLLIALGIKEHYIYTVKGSFYGFSKGIDEDRQWVSDDFTNWFNSFATSVGLKAGYRIKFIEIGLENWFGITNLVSQIPNMRVTNNSHVFSISFIF
jgi:hypothetical protein